MSEEVVFISYAREDARYAERLYMNLREANINAWIDSRSLLPGQKWKREISKIIHNASYFILLISKNSLNKRGFVQNEIKQAFSVLSELPSNQIFLIPARLDDTIPFDEELRDLNWVDLFPDYDSGMQRILSVLSNLQNTPLVYTKSATTAAPINYTPYRSFFDFVSDFLNKLPKSSSVADRDYAMYIRLRTQHRDVVLPPALRKKYPDEIIIVLQHQFDSLTVLYDKFTVVLWFDGKPKTIVIPFNSIQEIIIPTVGVKVEHFSANANIT